MYKIRVILDAKEDVIRTISVNDTITLEDLHFIIAKSFDFDGQEMASFYRTDNEWNQGEEIPLFNMDESGAGISMATELLNETLPKENSKLIYVYDFLAMWLFYVEVIEITNKTLKAPKTILSVGKIPKEVQKKEFKADTESSFDIDEETDEDFNNFDNFDDFDFYEN